jgi:hypothetical protein
VSTCLPSIPRTGKPTPHLGKRLKRRLEDLERRAGSPSNSFSQTPTENNQSTRAGKSRQQHRQSPETQQSQSSLRFLLGQSSPPMQDEDEGIFANGFEEDRSSTAPLVAYHICLASEDTIYPPYSQPYKAISTSRDWAWTDTDYLTLAPVTLLSTMQLHDSVKREYEDTFTPINMTYYGLLAVEIQPL